MSNRITAPNTLLIFALVVALAPLLGGCVPLVFGGAAVGATLVAQERPVSTAISDTTIQAGIDKRLLESNVDIFKKVDISVVEGRVLLTGLVPEPQNRLDAARIAWQPDGVKEVINEIEVVDRSSLSDAARDTWITTKLRSKITFDDKISGINYTIDTVNQRIYLIGIARSQEELDRVIAYARDTDYVRGVVPYVRVK
ncbi:MAG: BON domain-containing protein [Alphaproteobacteria bacterium]|nr:BON domain-containing protein [Alphaproteobacteria bacterium]